MSRDSRLRQLLNNPRIWRYERGAGEQGSLPTGFRELDERLGGGWPLGALTELLLDAEGAGELRLLMPALARLSHEGLPQFAAERPAGCWITWVAPPHIPYPPALAQHDVNIGRLLIARPENPADVLWSIEQALRSAVCGAVLGWLAKTDDRSLRRLQLAAESSCCLAVIFRHARFASAPSPAPLRIRLRPDAGGSQLELLRNRYGQAGSLGVAC